LAGWQVIMFTGLITHIGQVGNVKRQSDGLSLTVECPDSFMDDVQIGDSVAVSGACLTVTQMKGNQFTVDISRETIDCSTISKWLKGRKANLEKSLKASDSLGGHFVMGHVDGIAKLVKNEKAGEGSILTFETSEGIAGMIVPKGSVSIDGVSLTPASSEKTKFSIAIIPHTLANTTLADLSIGDEVNVEIDIFARYIFEFLKSTGNLPDVKESNLTIDELRKEGF